MTDVVLEVEDLTTTLPTAAGAVRVLDGVSLTVERGRTLGLVGESGSGKSMLCRSVMGILPAGARVTGRIAFDGRELLAGNGTDPHRILGRDIAIVLQDPMTSLNPVVRIERLVSETLRHHLGSSRGDARIRAEALLQQVGLPDPKARLRQYPHELSGGMRQRVAIAIALSCGPKLLLADEPTTALDVTVQRQILDLITALQRERAMGMVLVTHDLGVVAGRTDEIAVLYAGRIVERAPTKALFRTTRHPYTEALIEAIPRLTHRSHDRLRAIPGLPPSGAPPVGCAFAPRCRYAQDRCRAEAPPLVELAPGHLTACFFPTGAR